MKSLITLKYFVRLKSNTSFTSMTDDEIDANIEPIFNKLSEIINNGSAKV